MAAVAALGQSRSPDDLRSATWSCGARPATSCSPARMPRRRGRPRADAEGLSPGATAGHVIEVIEQLAAEYESVDDRYDRSRRDNRILEGRVIQFAVTMRFQECLCHRTVQMINDNYLGAETQPRQGRECSAR